MPHPEQRYHSTLALTLPVAVFQHFFTDRLSGKFLANQKLNIPPHLKYITTVPCEMFMVKNRNDS